MRDNKEVATIQPAYLMDFGEFRSFSFRKIGWVN